MDAESSLYSFLLDQKEYPRYDVQFALRTCRQHGLLKSCIHLYCQIHMYEAAVDLALRNDDVELAKICANRLDDEEQGHLKKKLWLKMCKYMIQIKKDIKW